MAPTSATKKKPSAATKRKVATKKKTSVKPKAAGKATLVSRKRKKPAAKEVAPIPVLPSDWPVTSQPPTFPPEASALRPGSLLQQTCSGNDIQLARAACVVPSFDKQKGKFLLIFPGNFSFGSVPDTTSNAESDKTTEGKQEETTATKKAPASSATMGRIEGLRTSTPSFRVPFPHLQKSLVFAGKKIETTSKFLALSCSNKKSGTVQCKNIFSSAVVFGMPKWESTAENGKVVSTPISTATSAIVSPPSTKLESGKDVQNAVDETRDDSDDTKIKRSFLHYGGSERTVDGATRSSRKSLSQKDTVDAEKTATATEERVPIFSSHANSTGKPASTFDFSNNPAKPAPIKPAATPKSKTLKYDTSSSDDDEELHLSSGDSDDEFDAKLGKNADLTGSATKTRLPPRRQASMAKKKYVEDDEEDQESSEDESDKSDASKKKKKAPAAKKGPSKTTKAATPAKASKAKKQTPPKKASTAAKTKKKSATKKKTKVIELDDDSSSYASEQAKTPSSSSSAQKRSAPRRKSTSQKKNVYKEDDESDDADSEKENASNASGDSDDVTPKKAKAAPKKATPRSKSAAAQKKASSKAKITPSKSTPKSSGTKRPRPTSASAKNAVSVLESSSTTPSPGKSPSFRRRHKKKSPTKKSRTVLDLTQDDEFTFG